MDRYKAMGVPYPDPETVCLGNCEGTGVYPVKNNDFAIKGKDHLSVTYKELPDSDEERLWWECHRKAHTWMMAIRMVWEFKDITLLWRQFQCDGWHFIDCAECGGTGKKKP